MCCDHSSPKLYYHLYQMKMCSRDLASFRTTSNHCKRVLENAKSSYVQMVHAKVVNKKPGAHQVWKITNTLLNRGKLSGPSIINCPEVISSSSDKAEFFSIIFAFYSMLEDKDHSLLGFPCLMEHKLCDITIINPGCFQTLQRLHVQTKFL